MDLPTFRRRVLERLLAAIAAAFVLVVLPRAIAVGAIALDQAHTVAGQWFLQLQEFLTQAGVAARDLQ